MLVKHCGHMVTRVNKLNRVNRVNKLHWVNRVITRYYLLGIRVTRVIYITYYA